MPDAETPYKKNALASMQKPGNAIFLFPPINHQTEKSMREKTQTHQGINHQSKVYPQIPHRHPILLYVSRFSFPLSMKILSEPLEMPNMKAGFFLVPFICVTLILRGQ